MAEACPDCGKVGWYVVVALLKAFAATSDAHNHTQIRQPCVA